MVPAPVLPIHPLNGAVTEGAPQPPVKSQKNMTKAERRELQEKQRAAKAAKQQNNPTVSQAKGATKQGPPPPIATPPPARKPGKAGETTPKPPLTPGAKSTRDSRSMSISEAAAINARSLRIFSHFGLPKPVSAAKGDIHPAILRLALQFSTFKISGANARCIATLTAFKTVSNDIYAHIRISFYSRSFKIIRLLQITHSLGI